jgi:hypothetical protein
MRLAAPRTLTTLLALALAWPALSQVPQPPPRPPPADASRVWGVYDAQHRRWRDTVVLDRDGRFWRAAGGTGYWTFNGSKVVLAWDEREPEELFLQPDGSLRHPRERLVLTRRMAPAFAAPAPGPFSAFRVEGERCPGLAVTVAEAQQRQQELCQLLGRWDIARLANGGAMDGPGYGCQVREVDARALGNALCRR